MAQPYVPPWLQISPDSFVQAAQGGARIGAELAGQQNEFNIARDRNTTGLQEAQMRVNAESEAQKQEAERAAAERALREWELRQQILHQNAQLQGENQRSQNTLDAENQRAAAALAERQQYGGSMLDIRREANRIAQERADAAAKPNPTELATAHTGEVKPHDVYTIQQPGVPHGTYLWPGNWGDKDVPPSTLTTTNTSDLLGVDPSRISTNKIPGSPALTWKIPSPNSQPASIPTVDSQDAYDALGSGDKYYDADGNLRTKK